MTHVSEAKPDQQLVYFSRFDERLRQYVRSIITPELIAKHKTSPLKQNDDTLARILDYFRKPPKFGLYSHTAFKYQIISLPIPPGSSPQPLDEHVFSNKDEAIHAVFLKHVDDILKH